ncbi:tRNA pseudouridine(55) synthase TruB [Propionimicrobium sp. PCR01-08-3]|uniref:tRNA pseudouridine(55) synthase TruB n=1 Tax=Propionimicrobium sp. PCR01-08-3 TaxID=3052086 RepID=UPI00255CD78A|nr:tRNA pseudouridine(55) synthase TruB [Propionimicrobium sp. PCR01-08-3]WIY81577.1 tRNA pseudouridine(55) synthase TruB [Propionimicrobium sp. PCR01-08-3]
MTNSTDPGLLIIDKPAGLTSHQVVARVRRVFGTKKVGHAGTLDPMATGVLIVGLNRATRLLGHLALHDKAYSATIRLGASTTTDDAEGETLATADASGLGTAAITDAIVPLRGVIRQRPSAVSAIKVDGKRAYARVRAGEDVQLPAREVTVSRFDVLATRVVAGFTDVDVAVECSSGTYVRALARDLGIALGVGGHLTALRRTRIGRYTLDQATELCSLTSASPLMTMAEAARLSFPVVEVDAAAAKDVSFGRALAIEVPAEVTGIVGPSGDLLALYRPDAEGARPIAVLI